MRYGVPAVGAAVCVVLAGVAAGCGQSSSHSVNSLPTSLAPERLRSALLTAGELEAAGISDAAASEGTTPLLPCAFLPFEGRRFVSFLEGASEYVASVPESDARRFMRELRRCVGTSAHPTGGGGGDTVGLLPIHVSGAGDAIGFQIHGTTTGFMHVPYTIAALAVRRGRVVLYLSASGSSGAAASGTLARLLKPAIAKVHRTAASVPGAP